MTEGVVRAVDSVGTVGEERSVGVVDVVRRIGRRRRHRETEGGHVSEGAIHMVQGLLRDGRDELRRADEKASTLLSAFGIVTALLGKAAGGPWAPAAWVQDGRMVWWLGVVSAGVAITLLISALTPRLPSAEKVKDTAASVKAGLTEHGAPKDWYLAIHAFPEAAARCAASDLFEHMLDQIQVVRWIAWVKYRRIQAAVVFMVLAAASIGAALILQVAG